MDKEITAHLHNEKLLGLKKIKLAGKWIYPEKTNHPDWNKNMLCIHSYVDDCQSLVSNLESI